jgi:hypothetical protein
VRPALLTAFVAALAALAGCDSDPPRAEQAQARQRFSYEERVIRGWLLALERMDYDGAAYYFAPGALIDQGEPYRLRNQSAARAFNAGLPCRADLTGARDEGPTVLASFRLRRGPGGACSGTVRVRFTIREGKFREWRQLPEEPPPAGEPA